MFVFNEREGNKGLGLLALCSALGMEMSFFRLLFSVLFARTGIRRNRREALHLFFHELA